MKVLVAAYEIEIGHEFIWKGDRYKVIQFYDENADADRMIVRRAGSANDEYFNPYCQVEQTDA